MKTKYGEDILKAAQDVDTDTTSSEDDDEDDVEIDETAEKEFLRTLSALKSKSPKIYEESTRFFNGIEIDPTVNKKVKTKPIYVNDYERQFLLEKGGRIDEEEK